MDERKYGIPCYEEDETEISLLDILLIIAEGKKVILYFSGLSAGGSYDIFLKEPNIPALCQISDIEKTGEAHYVA